MNILIASKECNNCLNYLKKNFRGYKKADKYTYYKDEDRVTLLCEDNFYYMRSKRFDVMYIDKESDSVFKNICKTFFYRCEDFGLLDNGNTKVKNYIIYEY